MEKRKAGRPTRFSEGFCRVAALVSVAQKQFLARECERTGLAEAELLRRLISRGMQEAKADIARGVQANSGS